MITIFFDNVLVNDDDYLEIKNEYKMFDKSFYLGATPCNSYTIKVPNTYSIPNEVKIKMDDEDYATLIVDSYSIDDNDILTLKLVDNMVLFNKNYDASGIVPCTTFDILSDLCSTCGVQLGTNSFIGDDIPVNYYDNTITARDYISMLAELNGGYACIGADGKLYLRQFNNTPIELSIDECENFKIGEKRKVERVVFDNGLLKFETSADESLETLYLNNENVYINTETTFNNIANIILNFEFYNFSTGNCQVDYEATCGKIIKFVDSNNNEYLSIAQYNHNYNGKWLGGYELNLESVLQEETQIKGDSDKIKSLKIIQDRQQNEIDIISEDIDEQEQQIASVMLKYNEIISRISDIADITTSGESSYASVNLLNVNASNPIDIKINPLGTDIGYLYPHTALYPSNTLYPKDRILRFTNNTTSDVFDWELPANLWYYDATTFDSLELSYGDGTNSSVIITRKCEINSSGVILPKATPTSETYAYPTNLALTDGDYTISLVGYTNAYLYVQLMAKNIYTTQFYTQAETNSLIDQTASSIDLSVDQKLSNYSTTAEMNSAITVKANEITSSVSETYATKTTTNTLSSRISQTAKEIALVVNNGSTSSGITINITKEDGTTETATGTINMNGLVSFSNLSTSGETVINGANIQTGTLSASQITTGTLTADVIQAGSITTSKIATNLNAKNITGSSINSTSFNTTNGTFKVTSAGSVTATAGTIGGWTLANNRIYGASDGYTISLYKGEVIAENNSTHQATQSTWRNIINAGRAVSDKRLKNNIKTLDNYENFYDELKPVCFKYKEKAKAGDTNELHFGFIAQDIIENANKNIDDELSAVWEEKGYYNLNKQEFIALNTWQIQLLKDQVKNQQKEIELLKEEIEKLKGGK